MVLLKFASVITVNIYIPINIYFIEHVEQIMLFYIFLLSVIGIKLYFQMHVSISIYIITFITESM